MLSLSYLFNHCQKRKCKGISPPGTQEQFFFHLPSLPVHVIGDRTGCEGKCQQWYRLHLKCKMWQRFLPFSILPRLKKLWLELIFKWSVTGVKSQEHLETQKDPFKACEITISIFSKHLNQWATNWLMAKKWIHHFVKWDKNFLMFLMSLSVTL